MTLRWTDTGKWDDKWFRTLKPIEKLLFNYICDNCDCAGFWEIDTEYAAWIIGINPEVIEAALKGLEKCYFKNERFLVLKNFLFHQGNLPLNRKNKCHLGIMKRLGQHVDLWERLKEYWSSKNYVTFEHNLFSSGRKSK